MPVLPPGAPDLRVLHVSDLHLTPYQRRKRDWVASLRALEPDLVVNTGDNIAHRDAVDPLIDALGPLTERARGLRARLQRLLRPTPPQPVPLPPPRRRQRHTHTRHLPWQTSMRPASGAGGWTDLTNRRRR